MIIQLMHLSTIDEHFVLIESNFNWFNITYMVSTQKHILFKEKHW
jgi:hypothetical protein